MNERMRWFSLASKEKQLLQIILAQTLFSRIWIETKAMGDGASKPD